MEKDIFTSKTTKYKNYPSADGHCSPCFFSNKVVIGCAEPGRPTLQLDNVFLLQALTRQRMPHVLPDYLFHTFLGHLKCKQSAVKPNTRVDFGRLTTSPVGLSTHATVQLYKVSPVTAHWNLSSLDMRLFLTSGSRTRVHFTSIRSLALSGCLKQRTWIFWTKVTLYLDIGQYTTLSGFVSLVFLAYDIIHIFAYLRARTIFEVIVTCGPMEGIQKAGRWRFLLSVAVLLTLL